MRIKVFTLVLLLLGIVLGLGLIHPQAHAHSLHRATLPPEIDSSYTQTWGDEFTGTSLDGAKWTEPDMSGSSMDQGSQAWVTPQNTGDNVDHAWVEVNKQSLNGMPYTAGQITSRYTKSFQYGYFEISEQFPSGPGLWGASWMVNTAGTNCSEIDFPEVLGKDSSTAYFTYHRPDCSQQQFVVHNINWSTGYHRFGMKWTPTAISFYLDDVLIGTATGPITSDLMNLKMNLDVGNSTSWAGAPDSTTPFPSYQSIDYVRVYQQTAATPTPPPSPSPTPSPTPSAGYVTVTGQHFYQNGARIKPYGSTMYPVNGAGWQQSTFSQYIDSVLNEAQKAHVNVIRATNYLDNVPFGDWYNAQVWANMDYLFSAAQSRGMFVLLDLSSIRDRYIKNGINPYSDPTRYEVPQFTWIAQRYASQPNLLNYAIAGEVDCPNWHHTDSPASTSALNVFYHTLAGTLKQYDPNHLVSTGGLSYMDYSISNCGIDYNTIFGFPTIDITAIHVYSSNDQTISVPTISKWAASHNKPFTIEEFGFQQGEGDYQRSLDYQHLYYLCKDNGCSTIIFWNLGNLLGSTHYDVWDTTPLTWQKVIDNAAFLDPYL